MTGNTYDTVTLADSGISKVGEDVLWAKQFHNVDVVLKSLHKSTKGILRGDG